MSKAYNYILVFYGSPRASDGPQYKKTTISRKGFFQALKSIFERFFINSQIEKCLRSNKPYYDNFGFKMWILASCSKFKYSYKHPVLMLTIACRSTNILLAKTKVPAPTAATPVTAAILTAFFQRLILKIYLKF